MAPASSLPENCWTVDTETSGLEVSEHRIVEIAAVEIRGRRLTGRTFHTFVNPQRAIEAGATAIHGISNDTVAGAPLFRDVYSRFIELVAGSTLVIHNAPFDVGFLDRELALSGDRRRMADLCTIRDSLIIARAKHPGQGNSLDALCKRYDVDASDRHLHGALIDATLLAEIYLRMTSGQEALELANATESGSRYTSMLEGWTQRAAGRPLPQASAPASELKQHLHRVTSLQSKGSGILWPESVETDQGLSPAM